MLGSRWIYSIGMSTLLLTGSAVHAEPSRLPMGRSLGEPTSPAIIAALSTGPLAKLENDIDEPELTNEDISGWSDEQVLKAYSASVEQVDFWLDTVRQSPAALEALSSDQVASLHGGGRGHALSGVSCLAMAIQGEAGGEPTAGKQAVAATVMSRASGNASRVCAVVFAHDQFESMAHHPTPSADSLRVAKESISGGAKCTWDHFINKKLQLADGRKIPDWVHTMEKKGCPEQTIGLQTYFKACACGL